MRPDYLCSLFLVNSPSSEILCQEILFQPAGMAGQGGTLSRRSLGFSSPYRDQLASGAFPLEESLFSMSKQRPYQLLNTTSPRWGLNAHVSGLSHYFRKMLAVFLAVALKSALCAEFANFKIAQTFPHVLVLLKSALKTFS